MKIERLAELLKDQGIDHALICDPNVILYYTGYRFSPGERLLALLVNQDGSHKFFLNKLFNYAGTITAEWFYDADNGMALIARELNGTVAIDKNMAAHFLLDLFELRPDLKLIKGTVIDEVKAVKTPAELAKMITASKRNDEVMAKVKTLIKPGISERALRDLIDAELLKFGPLSFDTIVLFGDHAADPHGQPGERLLKANEAVVVDMGVRVADYCSDMTRTFFVGANGEKEIYDTVLKANLAGIKAVKPGVPFKEVDLAARKVITEAGYGDYFIHRLGHGIGVDEHEPFDVSATDEVVIKEGMCFSIEPGIYIPGRVGIRIEDLVYVDRDGAVLLNHYPKDEEVIDQ